MERRVRRLYVEKKKEFAAEANNLLLEIRENLSLSAVQGVRIINRYDVAGLNDEEYLNAKQFVFSEATVDRVYDEEMLLSTEETAFGIEYLPGQYDQRADSAEQCIQILTQKQQCNVKAAKIIVIQGTVSQDEIFKIKSYCINQLDSREASMRKPESLEMETVETKEAQVLEKFTTMSDLELNTLMQNMGLAMSLEDLKFCQQYFRINENRDPFITEIKVIDTYWSDHCRHTTFLTQIQDITVEESICSQIINHSLELYNQARTNIYKNREKDICLMDIATIAMKQLHQQGLLQDLEVSEENNACSIVVDVDVDGQKEAWLLMFKNETHNHPTEIEPFGGAATCLGGAIRDPLSGRAYVFGALRVTGSADPRADIMDTIPGKLPQRKITTGAAAGFSSYGNQIGLATGQVAEVYHPNYAAKRMEIGAVLGAVPQANVRREEPKAGDIVVLLGGRTGRDGCGGATGSSKEHDDSSLTSCGAEVQKGNPPTERKLQRFFRNPEVSRMIKKCNDFGAGGVSVAIGELASGLVIDLDAVPKKYEGLDGTELAISESQERMAVVIEQKDLSNFLNLAKEENLEAVKVAEVTEQERLTMLWKNKAIVNISREFLNTNGVKQTASAVIKAPDSLNYFEASKADKIKGKDLKQAWLDNLKDLNICSQHGLTERFDSSIGKATVLMPLGGEHQNTPTEGLVMKLPVQNGETNTAAIMTYGFNPYLSGWSPFHGAVYAIVEAVSKAVMLGGDYTKIRLTLQEYFEKLGKTPEKWGKPLSALLGAYYAETQLCIPAIGGKDSMSGTFKDIDVPPTLVAFAVDTIDADLAVSQDFKQAGSNVVLLRVDREESCLPNFAQLKSNLKRLHQLITDRKILASNVVKHGGAAASLSKMCFGNMLGLKLEEKVTIDELFSPDYGNIIIEINKEHSLEELLEGLNYKLLGTTQIKPSIELNNKEIQLHEALVTWKQPLSKVFPSSLDIEENKKHKSEDVYHSIKSKKPEIKIARPKVLIPVFPGTNCEYDTAAAFQKAGGEVKTLVIKNQSTSDIEESISALVKEIERSQIIALPGGFSAGDEPDGSGKFISVMFRNPRVQEAVMSLLNQRDGLMLGICNGFQALVKLGLVPYGEIRDIDENSPTLTFNSSGRHISCMAKTRIVSNISPWLANVNPGDIHTIPISHGEGRFIVSSSLYEKLKEQGQIAIEYVGTNPNGSMYNVEAITSCDGRILGKMGHSERIGKNIAKNIPGEKDQKLFSAGIEYFK